MHGYTPKYYDTNEIVPRTLHDRLRLSGQLHRVWWLFDPRLLYIADRLRVRFGPMRINDWAMGGDLNYRGFRPEGCGVGSEFSDHKFGRALDLSAWNGSVSAVEMREAILADPWHEDFQYITVIEMDVDWLHFGVRNRDKAALGIQLVYP